ncbi:MAG TPA: hypothetical protein VHV08_00485, partial [Pirellulales bacterium]|nr:hypothetical protein [Pirellulales bacterium]
SDQQFEVRFGEPLDHALLGRMLWITDARGKKVAGNTTIIDEESCWRFKPERPWTPGSYELVVDRAIEDLAGNSIGRAFDTDVFDEVERKIETHTASVPWTTRAPSGASN